jgi:hypothetical protein
VTEGKRISCKSARRLEGPIHAIKKYIHPEISKGRDINFEPFESTSATRSH